MDSLLLAHVSDDPFDVGIIKTKHTPSPEPSRFLVTGTCTRAGQLRMPVATTTAANEAITPVIVNT